ncbi:MAG: hypothetical protein QOJ84_1735 [Bradyrhizobium sp.]|nr:hypothetical protein [Bradyrhizobium sp.]
MGPSFETRPRGEPHGEERREATRLEPWSRGHPSRRGQEAAPQDEEIRYSTSSGHGTIVDFTVFIAIASATARAIPSSENG